MIVYTEHPKESIKKLLELVTVMWDHKMKDHILKLILLLDTNSLLVFELRFNWKFKKKKLLLIIVPKSPTNHWVEI